MIGKKVVVRTFSAGVHYGTLDSMDGKVCLLSNSRRIWYWKGAVTLSELAVSGVKYPDECKFSIKVPAIILTEAIEIILCTEEGVKSIEAVKEWKV